MAEFEMKDVVDFLEDYLDFEELEDKVVGLKGIDWNPFDEDQDEYEGVWAEMHHNWQLLWDAVCAVTNTLERVVIGGVMLSNQEKHKAAVETLDRAIRLKWYLEPFDGPAINMLVKASVSWWNSVDWGIGIEDIEPLVELDSE